MVTLYSVSICKGGVVSERVDGWMDVMLFNSTGIIQSCHDKCFEIIHYKNANKEKISLCLRVAFDFNWCIISVNYIF